ncbi:MAG: PilC/PilY family type IV pilus protein [Aquabacterium sp.]
MKIQPLSFPVPRLQALLTAALLMLTAPLSHAGEVDISGEPLATRPEVKAKPNLLFILDNSGSMNWSYMPDDLGRSSSVTDEPYSTWYGYRAAQCNGTAYDPDTTYTPPLKADGVTSYPNASFSLAKEDGFNDSSSTRDLAGSYYYTYSGSQPRMGWAYTSSGVISNTFYRECSSAEGSTPGSNVFTKITLSSTSAQAQNYANWFSYYRKRYLLMRTAMGNAIKKLDSNYRVGFSTISDNSAVDGTNYFRDVKDFGDTQKSNFYSSLYSVTPNGSTPLRTALSKAGRYFAKKVSGQTYDPMQYACQRNYALLSTDGYWNGSNGVKLDGTGIGQQDGLEARPMRDDATKQSTEVITYRSTATRNVVSTTQTRTRTWNRTETTVAAAKGGSCSSTRYLVTTTSQRYIQSQTQRFVTPQTASASYTRTTVTTEGVVTSGPTDSSVSYGSWSNTASATAETTDSGDAGGSTNWEDRNVSTSCVTSPSQTAGTTVYTTATVGSWSSWSPSNVNYSASTPVVGTWTAGTPVVTDTSDAGTPNTLADVSEYYYATDLRTSTLNNCSSSSSGASLDVCNNIVPTTSADPLKSQHMNTFTIGLGLKGTLDYTDATLAALTAGTIQWPSPTNADTTTSGGGDATNIDDLWHTALNGRGQYFSALSAGDLSTAINKVVQTVAENLGASSAASTSSLELVAGENNYVYRASYTTNAWFGDLEAFTLNGETAAIGATPAWSAKARLDQTPASSRKIYFKGSSGLAAFTWGNLSAAQQAYFSNICTKAPAPAQCAGLTSTQKGYANNGELLVNYLRGDRTNETTATISGTSVPQLYRARAHLLGDIINGAPVHVGKPPFSYSDTGYADFVTEKAGRKPVVYVAANDGMLHAIAAEGTEGGSELWAYVPEAVMPNMYRLADTNYGSTHQYYVDGAPVMGDIKVGDTWKTILVGGLNKGGKSYYALDITDPENPRTLWEFTTANMGLSYGNPIITKRADGTWIVAVTSGFNNGSGDGKGHLYILNANTGALLMDLVTTAGSTTTPSGLARINAWIENPANNMATRFYGGDQQGNLWRFDVDSVTEPHQSAMLLAQLRINVTTPQPISVKPMTVEVSGKPVVIVATGRYMGDSDISDSTQQSIYAIRDTLTSTGWGDVRASTSFVQQFLTLNAADADSTSASVSKNTVDWTTKGGWRIDFPHSKERVFSNMGLQLGTLAIGTAIPSGDACASGGSSWRYYLNVGTGSAVSDNPVGVKWSPLSLIVGISWIKDINGNVRIIYQNSDSQIITEVPPTAPSSGAGSVHRTSWRELVD